jgi:2-oxoglutarate dehydrogenase E1 component
VYYDLLDRRAEEHADEVAIVRIEQFYPFAAEMLRRYLNRYRRATEWAWVQEESMNMGGWTYMQPRLHALGRTVNYVGRDASASPATGSHMIHKREQKELVEAAIRGTIPHLVHATTKGPRVVAEPTPKQAPTSPSPSGV